MEKRRARKEVEPAQDEAGQHKGEYSEAQDSARSADLLDL